MPKQTFINLDEAKRKQITDAFLQEFAVNSFDEASLSEVVKRLGIAKGSVYQYFGGKLDLFMYLVELCSSVKIRYVASIKRENFPDYWAYFRNLFEQGYEFDHENPLESHFLHRLSQNLNSPSVKDLFSHLQEQTVSAFEKMVAYEVEQGLFRDDVPFGTMGFLLYRVGASIQEQLEYSGEINPEESINQHIPVYQGKKALLMKTVDDYINLSRPAFDKPTIS